jgi:hypothetical protein
VVAAEVLAAAIPPQLRIRKPLHRVPLQCRIPVAARIRAGVLILLARGLVAARIPAVVILILLVRGPARIQAVVLLISLARSPRIPAAVLLILLARGPVAARIQAQRHTLQPAAARRVMRLRRSARRMRHKVISERNNARAV